MAFDNDGSFTIGITGEVTGTTYSGEFRFKKWLSHGERLARDRIRREHLGSAPNPGDYAIGAAQVFSECAVRLTSTPTFWKDNNNGLGLLDDSVVTEVYKTMMKIVGEAEAALGTQAEKAKETIKEGAAPNPG